MDGENGGRGQARNSRCASAVGGRILHRRRLFRAQLNVKAFLRICSAVRISLDGMERFQMCAWSAT